MIERADVAIVGGGIVGLATAWTLGERYPRLRVAVLEKEASVCRHQSGRNSGVLHSGIYYAPGSLKAGYCRQGRLMLQAFCEREAIPFEICGKVIVATDEAGSARLAALLERAGANGVRCEQIGPQRLRELEPHVAGVAAIHVPEAGIVDFGAVGRRLAERVRQRNGSILTDARVTGLRERGERLAVESTAGEIEARLAINCAGLHSDRVARLAGIRPPLRIVPFRGEYWQLVPGARHLCRNLVYPVPDPALPFLGVHLTRTIGGAVECGPNALPSLAREGYRKYAANPRDALESLTYSGFLRLAARHWRTGLGELWRSVSKAAFVRALQRLVPEIRGEHLEPSPAGVRAQALSPDGRLLDDFIVQTAGRTVHVLNAPSPAATAALALGARIVDELADPFRG